MEVFIIILEAKDIIYTYLHIIKILKFQKFTVQKFAFDRNLKPWQVMIIYILFLCQSL